MFSQLSADQCDSTINWKVKVYLLSSEAVWEDLGTGTIEISRGTQKEEILDFIQITSVGEYNQDSVKNLTLDQIIMLKNGNKDKRVIMYMPLIKTDSFEKQGSNKTFF